VLLNHTALKSAAVSNDFSGKPVILIKLTEPGAERFGEITKRLAGKRLGIIVAGKLLIAPVIREPIFNGTVQISGNFTEKEVSDLATKLNKSIPANGG
jgi:preprotein translocase subunit SecD